MDIQDVLKEMRDIADDEWEGVAPAVTIERWADAIEAVMGDPVMKMVWERDAEIERLNDALEAILSAYDDDRLFGDDPIEVSIARAVLKPNLVP